MAVGGSEQDIQGMPLNHENDRQHASRIDQDQPRGSLLLPTAKIPQNGKRRLRLQEAWSEACLRFVLDSLVLFHNAASKN